MTRDLILLGAAADGRSIVDIVISINDIEETWNLLGYLDDDRLKQGSIINDVPVLGPLTDFSKYDGCYFLGTFGSAKNNFDKKRIMNRLKIPIDRFATLIHPRATVSPSAMIGQGTVIYAGTFVAANAVIGIHVKISANCDIGHDTIIGDFVTTSSLVNIVGMINVGEGCFFGGSSAVKDHVNIGEWSIIGMGAIIIRDVEPYSTVVGNPSRVIKVLNPNDFKLERD